MFKIFFLVFITNILLGEISQSQLDYWDKVLNNETHKAPLNDRGKDRLISYLYYAQKLSPDDIDNASLQILNLFYPNLIGFKENPALLPLIQRFKNEKVYPPTVSPQEKSWKGEVPYHGLEILSWKPWALKSKNEFRPKPLPEDSEFWNNQLNQVKDIMGKATQEQKKQILFWAGMQGETSGDWLFIIRQYMKNAKVPLNKQLIVRDAIAKAIVDATIASFDAKYTYLVKRPNMMDPNLKTYISTPNHPSFPSAHSTVSAAIAYVLNYYFPENTKEWNRLLEEAGMSRIWAGIHFPIDHQKGKELGEKVGQAVIERSID